MPKPEVESTGYCCKPSFRLENVILRLEKSLTLSTPSRVRGNFFSLIPVVLASGLLVACSTPEPAQQDRFYSLAPSVRVEPTTTAPLRATLLVDNLAARGFLGGRQIVYRTQDRPLEVQRYHLYLWEEPPGRSIARNLAAALRAAQLFELVITPAQRSPADFLLGGEIERFEHLPTAAPPKVAADFRLTLMRGTDRRPLFTRRYQGQELIEDTDPAAMALAFNRLTERLVGDAVRDLQTLRPRLHGQQ
jgi:cholesterol transport system auxiliary component